VVVVAVIESTVVDAIDSGFVVADAGGTAADETVDASIGSGGGTAAAAEELIVVVAVTVVVDSGWIIAAAAAAVSSVFFFSCAAYTSCSSTVRLSTGTHIGTNSSPEPRGRVSWIQWRTPLRCSCCCGAFFLVLDRRPLLLAIGIVRAARPDRRPEEGVP
jgi:hypothetical protein